MRDPTSPDNFGARPARSGQRVQASACRFCRHGGGGGENWAPEADAVNHHSPIRSRSPRVNSFAAPSPAMQVLADLRRGFPVTRAAPA